MLPTLSDAVPRRGGRLSRAIGRTALRLLGWSVQGEFPDHGKLVVIAAPHRSNWDFVVALAAKLALGLDISWLGKHTLFRGPWAPIMRAWGGIPVDRTTSNDRVASAVEEFAARRTMLLTITPEGTRTPGVRWRTGFWHIAHGAGVPILPIAFDWEAKCLRLLPILQPRELEADLTELQARYIGLHGHHG